MHASLDVKMLAHLADPSKPFRLHQQQATQFTDTQTNPQPLPVSVDPPSLKP